MGVDVKIDRLKARHVARRCTQIYGLDYDGAFSPVAKIAFAHLFIFIIAVPHWPVGPLSVGYQKCLCSWQFERRSAWRNL